MKKIITFITITFAAAALTLAQGDIYIRTSTFGDSARVREAEGFPGAGLGLGNTAAGVANGTNFLMQFYAGAGTVLNSAHLIAIGVPVNSRNGNSNNGYWQESGITTLGQPINNVVRIPFLASGGPATFQLRAWWAGPNGNTYISFESALAANDPQMRLGASDLFYLTRTGNPLAEPPETPVELIGLQGFQLQVPEPSTLALAGLGAVALALFRQRQRF